MRFEDEFTSSDHSEKSHPEENSVWSITDRDLLNELKKPVSAPDFAPVVMSRLSRLHRAMPGLTGHSGRRQEWLWRLGLAASVLLVLTLSLRYAMNEQRGKFADDEQWLPAVNDIVRSIEARMDLSGKNLNAVYGAAGEVASHLRPLKEDDANSQPQEQDQLLPSTMQTTRRSIFPVERSYWSDAHNPKLGPGPATDKQERKSNRYEPTADSDMDESVDQGRDEIPPAPMPGKRKFAFSTPIGR